MTTGRAGLSAPPSPNTISLGREKKGATKASPFDLVNLPRLLEVARWQRSVRVGILDGPVAVSALSLRNVQVLPNTSPVEGVTRSGVATQHGTLVAALLAAGSEAPLLGIAPDCEVVVRPIFEDTGNAPETSLENVATAISDCLDARVDIINLSSAHIGAAVKNPQALIAALDAAMRAGVLVVAAAGNAGLRSGSSVITAHRWVLPVVAFTRDRRPMAQSTLSHSIGRRGLAAPGDRIPSVGAGGKLTPFSGSSAAAPVVTGAAAVTLSALPGVSPFDVRRSLLGTQRRTSVVPPLLDAWAAFNRLGGVA